MARGKAISVKVARVKVIKALEEALDKVEKKFKASEKADKDFQDAKEKWNKEVAKLALANVTKAENLRVNTRWNNVVNVDFDLPKSFKLPTEPERDKKVENFPEHYYTSQKQEIENAIRILKMSDEEVVSTSTYQAVAQYL